MKEINELIGCKIEILESKKEGVLAKIKFPFGKADTVNKNNRCYPLEVFSTAVKNLGEKIKSAFVPGMADHPVGVSGTQLSGISHILTDVWLENGKAWASANILSTSKGSDILKVLKSGVQMGSSLRGSGEVDKNGMVKPGLVIDSVDLVCNPSFSDDARVGIDNIVCESTILEKGSGTLSNEEKKNAGVYNPRATIMENKIENRSKTDSKHYREHLESGGKLSFEDWKKGFKGE